MLGSVLGEEEVVGLVFESECIDESVVLLKVVAIFEEEDDFVDVILGTDGGAEGAHDAVVVLDEVAVDDRFDDTVLGVRLHQI